MAIELPTKTTNEFYFGKESLDPTVQVMEVEVLAVTAHGIPSIVTVGVAKLRLTPVRVMGYDPKTSPLSFERVFTIGVLSSLNSIVLDKVNMFPPSS